MFLSLGLQVKPLTVLLIPTSPNPSIHKPIVRAYLALVNDVANVYNPEYFI